MRLLYFVYAFVSPCEISSRLWLFHFGASPETMSKIAKLVDAVKGIAKSGGAIYQIDITDVPNGKFVIDLKSGAPTAYIG